MKKVRFLICAILGMASAILSFNASATTHAYWRYSPTGAKNYYDIGSTCAAVQAYFSSVGNTSTVSVSGTTCTVSGSVVGAVSMYFISCTDPQVPTGASGAPVCSDPEPEDPPPCADEAGQSVTEPFFLGNSSYSGAPGIASPYQPPGVMCISSCKATLTKVDSCYSRAYLPTSPKFGSHAVFCDATYVVSGTECDGSEADEVGGAGDGGDGGGGDGTGGTGGEGGGGSGSPSPSDNPKDSDAPSCPPGTYAVKSGSQWICNGIDSPHPKPDEEGCPAGTKGGTVNGQHVCLPTGDSKNGLDGLGSGTSGVGGANGSGTYGDNASSGAGNSTSDTGGANGGSSGSSGSGKSDGVGKSSIGVDCGAPPACSGDPLLCAIQIQEFESSCQTQKIIGSPLPDDELEKWKAVGGELDDSSEVDGAISRVEQKLSAFSSKLSFSTGSCPPDFNISVMGRSISIAISEACPLLQVLKMLLFMGAYLMSLRVLWSSVL